MFLWGWLNMLLIEYWRGWIWFPLCRGTTLILLLRAVCKKFPVFLIGSCQYFEIMQKHRCNNSTVCHQYKNGKLGLGFVDYTKLPWCLEQANAIVVSVKPIICYYTWSDLNLAQDHLNIPDWSNERYHQNHNASFQSSLKDSPYSSGKHSGGIGAGRLAECATERIADGRFECKIFFLFLW